GKVRGKKGTWYMDSACSRNMTGTMENIPLTHQSRIGSVTLEMEKRVKSLE
ncbi:hypothetical protein HAX54_017820, partial [Datura stramonium]|nr:hypothetical protein [Datura stramonium]